MPDVTASEPLTRGDNHFGAIQSSEVVRGGGGDSASEMFRILKRTFWNFSDGFPESLK